MQNIGPCLWFDHQAEEAANFYVSTIKNSKIQKVTYYGEGLPLPEGTVLTVEFTLDGHEFMALNGGPVFEFTPAISFVISCISQDEVDYYWQRLTEGGEESQCGWLTDKYGVSWQIVPKGMDELIAGPDREASNRAVQAMLAMKKLDLSELRRAYEDD